MPSSVTAATISSAIVACLRDAMSVSFIWCSVPFVVEQCAEERDGVGRPATIAGAEQFEETPSMTAPHSVARAGLRRDPGSAPSMSPASSQMCAPVPCVLCGLMQREHLHFKQKAEIAEVLGTGGPLPEGIERTGMASARTGRHRAK